MIYFDGVHMMTDDAISELHYTARRLRIKREWFQDHHRHPHYDVWGKPAERVAKDSKVIVTTTREMLRACRRLP